MFIWFKYCDDSALFTDVWNYAGGVGIVARL